VGIPVKQISWFEGRDGKEPELKRHLSEASTDLMVK
jgi:hypothetical protein